MRVSLIKKQYCEKHHRWYQNVCYYCMKYWGRG